MKVEYLPLFVKDLKALKNNPIFSKIQTLVFEEIPNYNDVGEIRNLTKLTNYENCYRIRVGDYRIGILIENDTLTFARVLHRREIYRYFP